MTKLETLQLKLTATRVRMGVIEATHGAGCGHPGGSLSAADVLTICISARCALTPNSRRTPTATVLYLARATAPPACMPRWRSAASSRWPTCHPAPLQQLPAGAPQHEHRARCRYEHRQLGPGVSAACGMALAAKKSGSDITSTPCWAMARSRRANAGRPSCSPTTTSSITCAS